MDLAGDYVIELVVSEGTRTSLADTVTISTDNTAPQADAGPDQAVFVGDLVWLDAAGSSDVNGDPLTYDWTLVSAPAGSAAALSDPTAVRTSLTIDLAGDYVFELTVDDGLAFSAADQVVLSTDNLPPQAGPLPNYRSRVNQTAEMDPGFASDPNGDLLNYDWSVIARPGSSSASMQAPADDYAVFTTDVSGHYLVQLALTDPFGEVSYATQFIGTNSGGGPIGPAAEAGPAQTVAVGDTVELDGARSSDVDQSTVTFSWALLSKPAGSAAFLSDAAAVRPTFVADQDGLYVAQLIVHDGGEASPPDTVVISTTNSQPETGHGGYSRTSTGNLVTLDVEDAVFDADGDALTYDWALISIPAGSNAVLSDPSAAEPTFTADQPGFYVAQLQVHDGTILSRTARFIVTTTNATPWAIPSGPDSVPVGTEVEVLAGYWDPNLTTINDFRWSLLAPAARQRRRFEQPAHQEPHFHRRRSRDLRGPADRPRRPDGKLSASPCRHCRQSGAGGRRRAGPDGGRRVPPSSLTARARATRTATRWPTSGP